MSTVVTAPSFGIPPLPVRKFSVAEYHRMIDAGILSEEDRVELLEGWLVPKMTRKPRHDMALILATQALAPVIPAGWFLRSQCAITTLDSEPEPDLSIARGNPRQYDDRHPGPAELGLVVEIADSTLVQDRREKVRVCARAGIPCYWIINVVDGQIEVYSDPSGPTPTPTYQTRNDYAPPAAVPLVLDGRQVAALPAADLLP